MGFQVETVSVSTMYESIRAAEQYASIRTSDQTLKDMFQAVEDVVRDHVPFSDVYVGFQRASIFREHEVRYRALADRCRKIVVWGVADVSLPDIPNVTFVALDEQHPLANEQFLLVDTPIFSTVLAARATADNPAVLEAVWLHNIAQVEQLAGQFQQVLSEIYRPPVYRDQESQHLTLTALSRHMIDHHQRNPGEHALLYHRDALAAAGVVDQHELSLALDTSGLIWAASPAAELLLGVSQVALRGQPLASIASRAAIATSVQVTTALKSGVPQTAWPAPHNAASEQFVGWMVMIVDSRAITMAERTRHERIVQLVQVLEQQMHELQAFAALLPNFQNRPGWSHALQNGIEVRAQPMIHRTQQVEALHQLEQHARMANEQVDLVGLAQQVADELRSMAGFRKVQLTIAAPDPVALHGDATWLRILFQELFMDALNRSTTQETIGLALEQNGNEAVVRIASDVEERLPAAMASKTLSTAITRAVVYAHRGVLETTTMPNARRQIAVRMPIDVGQDLSFIESL